jgi:hypothetical protein
VALGPLAVQHARVGLAVLSGSDNIAPAHIRAFLGLQSGPQLLRLRSACNWISSRPQVPQRVYSVFITEHFPPSASSSALMIFAAQRGSQHVRGS